MAVDFVLSGRVDDGQTPTIVGDDVDLQESSAVNRPTVARPAATTISTTTTSVTATAAAASPTTASRQMTEYVAPMDSSSVGSMSSDGDLGEGRYQFNRPSCNCFECGFRDVDDDDEEEADNDDGEDGGGRMFHYSPLDAMFFGGNPFGSFLRRQAHSIYDDDFLFAREKDPVDPSFMLDGADLLPPSAAEQDVARATRDAMTVPQPPYSAASTTTSAAAAGPAQVPLLSNASSPPSGTWHHRSACPCYPEPFSAKIPFCQLCFCYDCNLPAYLCQKWTQAKHRAIRGARNDVPGSSINKKAPKPLTAKELKAGMQPKKTVLFDGSQVLLPKDSIFIGTVALPVKVTTLPPRTNFENGARVTRDAHDFDSCLSAIDIARRIGASPAIASVSHLLMNRVRVLWEWNATAKKYARVPSDRAFIRPLEPLDTPQLSGTTLAKAIRGLAACDGDDRIKAESRFFLAPGCNVGVLSVNVFLTPVAFNDLSYGKIGRYFTHSTERTPGEGPDIAALMFVLATQGAAFGHVAAAGASPLLEHLAQWAHNSNDRAKVDKISVKNVDSVLALAQKGPMPAAPAPPGLLVDALPFQRQSIQWMLDVEHHGLNRHFWSLIYTPAGARVAYSAPLRRFAFALPPDAFGGFCCEQMGLGKTIITLGTMMSNPPPPLAAARVAGRIASRATLIVCSVSLIGQWIKEVERKLNGTALKMYAYHGSSRIKDPAVLAKYDIVITSYPTIAADFPTERKRKKMQTTTASTDEEGEALSLDDAASAGGASAAPAQFLPLMGKPAARKPAARKPAARRSTPPPPRKRHRKVLRFGAGAGAAMDTQADVVVDAVVDAAPEQDDSNDEAPSEADPVADLAAAVAAFVAQATAPVSSGRKTRVDEPLGDCVTPLQKIHWYRIVLDESHAIRMTANKTTKIVHSLKASHRWCVTGTPICTNVDDLLSQVRFLGIAPLDSPSVWRAEISNFANKKNIVSPLFKYFLEKCIVRHTMDQQLDGQSIMLLPSKVEEVRLVKFSDSESAAYQRLLRIARTEFDQLVPHAAALAIHTLQVLSLLGPLRQACSGGQAARSAALDDDAGDIESRPIVSRDNCSICLDLIERPTLTPCKHAFCRGCIVAVLSNSGARDDGIKGPCPLCRAEVRINKLLPAAFEDDVAPMDTDAAYTTFFESKLRALLQDLAILRVSDPAAKVLVFSQFQSTLDWLKVKLKELRVDFRTLEGHMSRAQRTRALDEFQNDPPTTIFLLSVRAGAVGINLTQANYVYLLEPCLNPALELQAVGRVHRMGQTRPVHVRRLIVENSIEEKLLKRRKTNAASSTTTTQAAAGALASDKQQLKYEEYLDLFA